MADARISTPLLAAEDDCRRWPRRPAAPVRVHLELQSDVMNDLRVLVENDRLLTQGSEKDPHVAPLPAFEEDAGAGPTSCGGSMSCWRWKIAMS